MDNDVILSYSSLTPFQKKSICNGCGGKGGFVSPPQFLFKASCNQHDFYYWRGGTEDDRKKADDTFYKFMLEDVNDSKWWKRPFYKSMAFLYYKSVRQFGKKFFYYTDTPRTIEDVIKLSDENKIKIRDTRNK